MQSVLVFGGQASGRFEYFADLWHFDWTTRVWNELYPGGAGPSVRAGHTAIYDPTSASMLVFAGSHLGSYFNELWQFHSRTVEWAQLAPTTPSPLARRDHSAVWDETYREMLVFAGENGHPLSDLHRYTLVANAWSLSTTPGPSSRSQHTAAWDAVTRSMLIFAGWSGTQYLQDLHRYDWWADAWTELLPATPTSPPAMGRHAAAWDPHSMSMLIFAGIQNSSGKLGNSKKIYKYSLLTSAWFQPEVPEYSPSARAHHAMIWDSISRVLLMSGGYNSSYLSCWSSKRGQLCRVLVVVAVSFLPQVRLVPHDWYHRGDLWSFRSEPESALVARCQVGQLCSVDVGRNLSGYELAVKDSCIQTASIEGLPGHLVNTADGYRFDLMVNGSKTTHLWVAPGIYRACLCYQETCPLDLSATLGYFIAEGPFLHHEVCYLGSFCVISPWRGVGISVNDSLVAMQECGSTAETRTFGQRPVVITFNLSTNSLSVDMGFVESSSFPEVVYLCWCPEYLQCSSLDHRAVALQLDIVCQPGSYLLDAACWECLEGHYCPGGTADITACPTSSTAPAGSSQLLRGSCCCHCCCCFCCRLARTFVHSDEHVSGQVCLFAAWYRILATLPCAYARTETIPPSTWFKKNTCK